MSIKKIYICSNCDAQFPKWSGRCLECGAWGSLEEEVLDRKEQEKKDLTKIVGAEIINLKNIKTKKEERVKTSWEEVDRVLGGGILLGSFILLSGEPGIGKSTLAAQLANSLARDSDILYVSGEESALQVKSRLERLACNLDKLQFIGETNVEKILAASLRFKPALLVVDSIQTIYSTELPAEPGSLSQIRAVAVKFLEIAKEQDITVLLIGHITKDGQVAGPKSLEHIVDLVLSLETEKSSNYSLLRASKNRFGSINELGILEMTAKGFVGVKNPSSIFLSDNISSIAGSSISCVMEGSRPFFVNVQALVSKTIFGYPQRKASGLDLNRLQVLSSVISKRTKLDLSTKDIIINLVGGLKLSDPALDLAVVAAIISSSYNKSLGSHLILIGELGLGGELRVVPQIEKRLKEAEKLGFKKALIPVGLKLKESKFKIEIVELKDLNDLLKFLEL